MADQRTLIAPSAQCREHDHHTIPVAVADDVAIWNEECCSECTTVYRGALDAGTTEEVAARVVRPRFTLLAAGDVSGAIPATQPEGDAFTRGTAVPCGYPDRRMGVRSREISSQSNGTNGSSPAIGGRWNLRCTNFQHSTPWFEQSWRSSDWQSARAQFWRSWDFFLAGNEFSAPCLARRSEPIRTEPGRFGVAGGSCEVPSSPDFILCVSGRHQLPAGGARVGSGENR